MRPPSSAINMAYATMRYTLDSTRGYVAGQARPFMRFRKTIH